MIGWEPACSGYFWLAAQRAYGIQAAAAASELAAAPLPGEPVLGELQHHGVDTAVMSPARLRRQP